MNISNKELSKIIFGAYRFEETADGYLLPLQFTKVQEEYFKHHRYADTFYPRCTRSNAKTIEFRTTAETVGFEYKIMQDPDGLDTVELSVDGVLIEKRTPEELKSGNKISFSLPKGEKDVVIYLPVEVQFLIKNFFIDADFKPLEKGEKVLLIGDSITQGYGPFRSAETYVSVANRILNYNIINQGIGGYYYDEFCLEPMPGYTPDKIIVALGTNHYDEPEFHAKIEGFYKRLAVLYKDIPVLTVTPVWREDLGAKEDVFLKLCEKIVSVCSEYDNIKVVNGFDLIPHMTDYFLDGVHPNALGCEVYGRNLADAIKKMNF